MPRFLNAGLAGCRPFSPSCNCSNNFESPSCSRSYHDKDHNDDHQWNTHEDRAYRMYVKENHHRYREFAKINENDRQAYWGWRHEHSDAVLKIDVR